MPRIHFTHVSEKCGCLYRTEGYDINSSHANKTSISSQQSTRRTATVLQKVENQQKNQHICDTLGSQLPVKKKAQTSLSRTHGFPAPTVPIPGLRSRPKAAPAARTALPSSRPRAVPPVTPRLQHGRLLGEPRGCSASGLASPSRKDPPR